MSTTLIAFGFPIPIIITFLIVSRKRLNYIGMIVFSIFIYVASILTGVASDIYIYMGNFNSAVIAGIISPIFYSYLCSFPLRPIRK